jgi:hypothetical protein
VPTGGSTREPDRTAVPISLTGHSPLVRLARRLPWSAGQRGRERAVTFGVFALGPTVIFWAWFLAAARHSMSHSYRGLEYAMPVSALWITFGPLLMQQWEYNFERLSHVLIGSSAADRWDIAAMRRACERADHGYLPFVLPMTIAAPVALWLAYPSYETDLSIRGPISKAGGLAVILFVGFVNANGMWGAYKSVQIVRAVTSTARPTWFPHRASQPAAMRELAGFSWSTALMFSAGAVFLPSLIIVQARLPLAPRLIVLLFVAVLFAGGFALFAIVFKRLGQVAQAQQDKAIDQVAGSIERVELSLQQAQPRHSALETLALSSQLRSLLTLRAAIQATNPLPRPQLISRAVSTLVLPLVLTALQFALTSVL